jgi:hypothetical protein
MSPGSYDAVLQYSVTESNGTVTDCVDPAQTLVIGSPAAVVASGGVSQLAGCTQTKAEPYDLVMSLEVLRLYL